MKDNLLLEFVKILNWTDKQHEVRMHVQDHHQTLLEKPVKGEFSEGCLKFRVALKVQLKAPPQTLKIHLSTSSGKPIGSPTDLPLQLKQKTHYLTLSHSPNKILHVNFTPEPAQRPPRADLNSECERVVQETMERKILTNIEMKRNDIFIQNREKFLTEYSRSKSRSKTKEMDFPAKINNLLQEVRGIKNAIRLSSSRSSSRVLVRQSQHSHQSNRTPGRLDSLHSIQQQPKLLQKSPRNPSKQLPKKSPKRYETNDPRGRFAPTSPDIYSEYGIIKTRVPDKKPVERIERVERERPSRERPSRERPSYMMRKNY